MGIIGWHYPKKQSLEYLIEQKKLYPITCFLFLKRQIRNQLIANNISIIVRNINGYWNNTSVCWSHNINFSDESVDVNSLAIADV